MNVIEKERTIENVNQMLKLAKIDENDVLPMSQAIYFASNDSSNNNYKLLQPDRYLLEKIEKGETLRIIGNNNENAVLCTEERTYNLIEAETSNCILLTVNLHLEETLKSTSERSISKVLAMQTFYDYVEVLVSKPKFKKMKEMLADTAYKGPEQEYLTNFSALLTIDDLLNTIQASRKELEEALNSMYAVTIDGKIRILDFEYHFRVLSLMLKLIDENSWGLDEIRYEETIESLTDLVPDIILNCLFNMYTQESKMLDGTQLYQYNEEMVCRFFAQVLLNNAGKFNLNDFLQAWKESVPEGMIAIEDMLSGIAIIDRTVVPNIIFGFPEDDLPEDVPDRLKILFNAKKKWPINEITPYIQKLATESLDVNALLAKYARSFMIDGVKWYCSKHGR